jgi:hypothetical protein
MVIISIVIAFVVRNSYTRHTDYNDYLLASYCSVTELNNLLKEYDAKSFEDIYASASVVIISEYSGKREIYNENVGYTVNVKSVLKGDVSEGEDIKIMDFTVFDTESYTVTSLYGNIPLIRGNQYLFLLNEQESHSEKDTIYYITTQSPFGKYLIGGDIIIDDGNMKSLKSYDKIAFIASDIQTHSIYSDFYKKAMGYVENEHFTS